LGNYRRPKSSKMHGYTLDGIFKSAVRPTTSGAELPQNLGHTGLKGGKKIHIV
jgi:hypothetical protein